MTIFDEFSYSWTYLFDVFVELDYKLLGVLNESLLLVEYFLFGRGGVCAFSKNLISSTLYVLNLIKELLFLSLSDSCV